ncbi:MAG: hypothetical protein EKE20_18125, partial [Candidatus Symbiopectobacterium sp. Dall1.0]|nr:hypothetical protein [Candidatus Symbiopectobacterium sp. Dall1.0]
PVFSNIEPVAQNGMAIHVSRQQGLVGAKLQNATSGFFELDLSKNYSPVKWLPLRLPIDDSRNWNVVTGSDF